MSNTQEEVSLRVKAQWSCDTQNLFNVPHGQKQSVPLSTPMLSKVVSGIGKNGEHPLVGARHQKSTSSMCRVMGQMPIVSLLGQINSGTWGIFKGVLSVGKWFHVCVGGPGPTGSLGSLNSFVYNQPVLWGLSGTQIDL